MSSLVSLYLIIEGDLPCNLRELTNSASLASQLAQGFHLCLPYTGLQMRCPANGFGFFFFFLLWDLNSGHQVYKTLKCFVLLSPAEPSL